MADPPATFVEAPSTTTMTASQRQQLLKTCKAAIDSFTASSQSFRVVSTVSATSNTPMTLAHQRPRTLFILDSSYNPPTRAHAALASSAIAASRTSSSRPSNDEGSKDDPYASPTRLLLLFSTHNADKGVSPAAFEHRLAMMIVFARDLSSRLDTEHAQQAPDAHSNAPDIPDIDIGLTTEPIYHHKTAAISAATGDAHSPPHTRHIHIVGHDTITRVFNPKYYQTHTPPLSALAPYFAHGHGFRVAVRPPEPSAGAGAGAGPEADPDPDPETQQQLRWPDAQLASGALEPAGAPRAWATSVVAAAAGREARGVSSTKAREAAAEADDGALCACCSESVVRWIRGFGLYRD